MDTFLTALGWWNFLGSIFMITFLKESFGRKVLNEWTRIFNTPFTLDYWSRFWLAWAIGLNIFFGLVNIYAAKWEFLPLKQLCIVFDLAAYLIFMLLTIWGVVSKRTGSGIYSVFIIFLAWICWGSYALING